LFYYYTGTEERERPWWPYLRYSSWIWQHYLHFDNVGADTGPWRCNNQESPIADVGKSGTSMRKELKSTSPLLASLRT